jgi:hypothetical protein
MRKPTTRKTARKSPVRRSRTIKGLTYEEARNALMSAISRERGYPMDSKSVGAISEEAERWIQWSKRASRIVTESLTNDPDEIVYQIYERLRIDRGWFERVPQAQAKRFWQEVWRIALQEAPVKAKHEQERRDRNVKWWRENLREKAKSRFRYEASKGTMCDDLISAARAFYQPESGEVVIPLQRKSS